VVYNKDIGNYSIKCRNASPKLQEDIMLEKLEQLLGEELSKQVTEKLGTVELAIFNDGSVVRAEKYETLKTDHKNLEEKYHSDISEVNTKLESAVKNAGDLDALKGTLETLKTDNTKLTEDYQTNLQNIKVNSAIDVALLKANVKPGYDTMLKTQLNRESLTFDGDNLVGLTDSITNLQTSFPELFGEMKVVGIDPQSNVIPQIRSNSYHAQYQEAIKAGHTKDAIKIKQEAYDKGEGF